jgi:hypothetical protein
MVEPAKSDHITIVANDKNKNEGGAFRRFGSREKGDAPSLFSRTKTMDSEADVGTGFDRPRRSDFASKQTFHGWKLIL